MKARDPKGFTWRIFPWDILIASQAVLTYAVIDASGQLEGLMSLTRTTQAVKVEYVATAPWNFGPTKQRKGVGPSMLAFASNTSAALKLGGALVLSSTPESETFYDTHGVVHRTQMDRGLKVYELPAAAAPAFVQKYRPITVAPVSSAAAGKGSAP